jgi:hypothetical protein
MTEPITTDVASLFQSHPEIAALQEVMRAVEGRLTDILGELPQSNLPLLANALLNVAVNHILAEAGSVGTASMLQRLAGLILAGDRPADGDGYRLDGQDA